MRKFYNVGRVFRKQYMDGINMAQDILEWTAFVNTVTNFVI
jgi:hypothetical protein